jgi:type II secretory pathway component PulF
MPSFTYTARNSQGDIVDDVLDAPNRREALRRLQLKELKVLKMEEEGAAKKAKVK